MNRLPHRHTLLHVTKLSTKGSLDTVSAVPKGMSLACPCTPKFTDALLYKMETELSQQYHDVSQRGLFWNKGRKIISQETVLYFKEMLSCLRDGVSRSFLRTLPSDKTPLPRPGPQSQNAHLLSCHSVSASGLGPSNTTLFQIFFHDGIKIQQ